MRLPLHTPRPVRLTDVFPPSLVILGLRARARDDVVSEIVTGMAAKIPFDEGTRSTLTVGILAREAIGSTAIANGVAFPHCRTSLVGEVVGSLVVDARGIDFKSVDRAPVHIIWLVLGPLAPTEDLANVLEGISKVAQSRMWRSQLRKCRSPEEIISVLEDIDADTAVTTRSSVARSVGSQLGGDH